VSALAIESGDVQKIATDVCAGFLGLSLEAEPEPPVASGVTHLTAFVCVSGEWVGAIAVHFSGALAREIASSMFGSDADAVGELEVHDAVGEVANMIGGSIKNRVKGSCTLSPPGLIAGKGAGMRVPGAHRRLSWRGRCGEEPLLVDVWERGGG
jgi:chemotaxis protein CheX